MWWAASIRGILYVHMTLMFLALYNNTPIPYMVGAPARIQPGVTEKKHLVH